jgi:hypothetical protein
MGKSPNGPFSEKKPIKEKERGAGFGWPVGLAYPSHRRLAPSHAAALACLGRG